MLEQQDDSKQREQALTPNKSYIIQAPAGSGKTELLIQRYLVLLHQVKNPEEILAITFTKKAAYEMRLRVINALKQAAYESEPDSAHNKKTWHLAKQVLQRDQQLNWKLMDNPNQLSIQTIDSLCAYLTKQLPLLSHFGSQPEITDNPFFLYEEAVNEILTHVENNYAWSAALANLLLHLDNDLNKLQYLLIKLLAKREQWLPYIRLDADENEIKKDLEKYLALINQEHLEYLNENFPTDCVNQLLSIARFASDQLSGTDSDLLVLRNLNALPTKKQEWLAIAKLLLTKNHTWRKRVDSEIGFTALKQIHNAAEKLLHQSYREQFTSLINSLEHHSQLQSALKELSFLPDFNYQPEQWDNLHALFVVLKILPAQLRLTFQKWGQIDFIENSQAALLALGNEENPTDLALSLDYQIQHILIDEFQDTSLSQYQLLKKLITGWENNDGRTLFVVGDPMQSIYRFREAEVGLFMRMQQLGIGHLQLIPLTLSVNFRSDQQIVKWNNDQFQKIFPEQENISTGAVKFNPSIAKQSYQESAINIFSFSDGTEDAQAKSIIQQIQTLQSTSTDKIAILVRSRSHLTALIPALRHANIPYRAVEIDVLESKPVIQDLFSLTCTLLHPIDRIAWLSVLRAPWCGLNLTDLHVIAKDYPYAAIPEILEKEEIIAGLSVDGQKRLNRILPILKEKILNRERYHLRTWIEEAWLQIAGPACLAQWADHLDVQAYFKLLDQFASNKHHLNREKLQEKLAQLYSPPQYDENVLQLMTIHTAKGLEFDTVILPHLEKKIPHDDKELLAWLEKPLMTGQSALLLASIHAAGNPKDRIYEYIIRQQKIKLDFEIERLLYVASTRAKKKLYLFFNLDSKSDSEEMRTQSGSFLAKLWAHLDKTTVQPHISLNPTTETHYKNRSLTRLPIDWINPYQSNLLASALHQQTNGFKLNDIQYRIVGTVVHRALQKISELGIDWWNKQSEENQSYYLQRNCKQLGLSPLQLDAAIKKSQLIIQNSLNDSRGQWILHAHSIAQSELKITYANDQQCENIIIDRTFVDENNIRWIIDYKTSHTEDDPIKFITAQIEKYEPQMHKYAAAFSLMEKRVIRLGLYFPLMGQWSEIEIKK